MVKALSRDRTLILIASSTEVVLSRTVFFVSSFQAARSRPIPSNLSIPSFLVSMNWTGGGLRRQSHNRPDSTLKIQKQYFAKARLKQRESHSKARITSIAGPSFAFCSGDAVKSPHCSSVEDQQPTQSKQSIDYADRACTSFDSQNSQSLTTGLLNTRTEKSVRDSRIPYFDLLKQYLLGKKDWVGLSPTRPLRMKFTPIEEKEKIGKRRKLSRHEEARSTALVKGTSNFVRISSHGVNVQQYHGTNDDLDWDMKIQISTPRRIGQVYHNPESTTRPRSASMDTMLSGVQEAKEDYDILTRDGHLAEKSSFVESDRKIDLPRDCFMQGPKNQCPSDQPHKYFDKLLCSSKREVPATLPETGSEPRSSSIPVLHRFTLDDQVQAERMANSQREAEFSWDRGPEFPDFYANRNFSAERDASEDRETLLSFSVKSRTEDRYKDTTDSHESNPTDSDVLPQTQKITRKLPPSQPLLGRTTRQASPSRILRSMHDSSTPKVRRLDLYNDNKSSPTMLFGQEVSPISPESTGKETAFDFSQPSIQQAPFLSNIHGYRRLSPHRKANDIPASKNTIKEPRAVSETVRPAPTFRFPSHWTPHRNMQRFAFTDRTDQETTAFPTSALVTPLPHSTRFIDGLPKRDQKTGLPMRNSLGILYENSDDFVGHEEQIMAPVFNTPFRRQLGG